MTLELFKFVGELICTIKDEEGNVIGERSVAQVTLYSSQFENLPNIANEVMEKVKDQ